MTLHVKFGSNPNQIESSSESEVENDRKITVACFHSFSNYRPSLSAIYRLFSTHLSEPQCIEQQTIPCVRAVFVNKVLLEHIPSSYLYIVNGCFCTTTAEMVAVTKTMVAHKPKMFTLRPY